MIALRILQYNQTGQMTKYLLFKEQRQKEKELSIIKKTRQIKNEKDKIPLFNGISTFESYLFS